MLLTVVDGSPEQETALRYAASRAVDTNGGVALLYVIEPHEIFPFASVEQSIDSGREAEAQAALQEQGALIEGITGRKPVLYIRHGTRREALVALIEQEPSLSMLVLGAGMGADGPGPLVDYLTSAKGIKQLKVPLVVLPPGYKLGRT